MAHVPDPDLMIRTGGELRLSNFLLWQAAYAELFFSDKLWPDFDETELDHAIAEFSPARTPFWPDLRPGRRGDGARRRPEESPCSSSASSLPLSCC